MKKEIQKIIENFENGLLSAGLNADYVNYDVLAGVRSKVWQELEDLLTDKNL